MWLVTLYKASDQIGIPAQHSLLDGAERDLTPVHRQPVTSTHGKSTEIYRPEISPPQPDCGPIESVSVTVSRNCRMRSH